MKVNVLCVKLLQYIPPFAGIYVEQALQLRDIDTLAICIESLALSNTHLTQQIKAIQEKLQITTDDKLNFSSSTPPNNTKLN